VSNGSAHAHMCEAAAVTSEMKWIAISMEIFLNVEVTSGWI